MSGEYGGYDVGTTRISGRRVPPIAQQNCSK